MSSGSSAAESDPAPVIRVEEVSHYYGSGDLRRQILHRVSVVVAAGEIVILTGPSGSGKTTLLTLMGGLRALQEGSLEILGRQLRGIPASGLRQVRLEIGYIFQSHNLLAALTATDNVELGLSLRPEIPAEERRRRSEDVLCQVGLEDRLRHYPRQLSGGQRQRVAIARALVGRPRIILADEPTAALDKKSGREVVDLLHELARKQGCAILLVTHDNRILDIADRIVHLEDGRISSFAQSVASQSRSLLAAIDRARGGDLWERVNALASEEFLALLAETTRDSENVLAAADLLQRHVSDTLLDEILEAFTLKIGQMLAAERATIFLLDESRDEIWSKVAQTEGAEPLDIRFPARSGIAGLVIETGRPVNIPDAHAHPLFRREIDERTGFRTRSILCMPIADRTQKVFAAIQLLNRRDGRPFDAADEARFGQLAGSIAPILEGSVRISRYRDSSLAPRPMGPG